MLPLLACPSHGIPISDNPAVSTDHTERVGVEAVRYAFAQLGWFVREPARPDYGVDLFVETAEGDRPTGRLLAVQVKSGASYVGGGKGDIVFRADQAHIEYWEGHSLPVIVGLHDPATSTTYWQAIIPDTAESTGKGWKIAVPRSQTLDGDALGPLSELANAPKATGFAVAVGPPPPELTRFEDLRADLTWMEVLDEGGSVVLEAGEWVNKTSGRGDLRLVAEPANGGPQIERHYIVFLGLRPYDEALPELFPWATFLPDEEVVAANDREEWMNETGIWDSEDKRYIGNTETFDEWRVARYPDEELRPYGEEEGEVAYWRLFLQLNDIGRGALALERYLSQTG
jgi:hypothetical protein